MSDADADYGELGEAWEGFDGDDHALVGVLTGSEGTFSAGATIPTGREEAFIDYADRVVVEQLG